MLDLRLAFRSLLQQGALGFLNIAGLALALALVVLLGLFVVQERSFDKGPEQERAYRIAHVVTLNDRLLRTALTPGPLAAQLRQDFPPLAVAARLYREAQAVSAGDLHFQEERFFFADPEIGQILPLRLVLGEPATALAEPNSVVITEAAARRYFGQDLALGKQLKVAGETFTVTGVAEDLSHRSHFRFDFLAPLAALGTGKWIETWTPHIFHTYLKLRPEGAEPAAAEALQKYLDGLVARDLGPRFAEALGKSYPEFAAEGQQFGYFLQPVGDIHLDSRLDFEIQENGSRQLVDTLSVLGLFILLIACANYLNLSTARAHRRALEVGLRKTVGAERSQLFVQFLTEAGVATLAAALLALPILAVLWPAVAPYYHAETLRQIATSPASAVAVILGLAALALLAGAYPAFVQSAMKPLGILRGDSPVHHNLVRKATVTLQFGIAAGLLLFVLVVQRQVQFLTTKDWGVDPRGVLVVNGLHLLGERWTGFKEGVLGIRGVASASATTSLPGSTTIEGYLYPGISTLQEDLVSTWIFEADPDFVDTLKIRMLDLAPDLDRQARGASDFILVNRLVPARLGWDAPLGRMVSVGKVPAVVRGVFDDVFVESHRQGLRPTVIRPLMRRPRFLAVRTDPARSHEALAAIEGLWRQFAPGQPFAAHLLEDDLARAYEQEQRLARILVSFALAAVFLAGLGVFGLASYLAASRVQEIAIRKAMGGTAFQVAASLSLRALGLVALGALLGAPLAYFGARKWLTGFAYRAEIPWWLPPLPCLLVLALALAATAFQLFRAALTPPAEILHHD